MEIFPAIDLLGGNVVRLKFGKYNDKKTYTSDALSVAEEFINQGAKNLHVVDLDGARSGEPCNRDVIKKLTRIGLFVELGGGIRNEEIIQQSLDLGVKRVILGTIAAKEPAFVSKMVKKYGDTIAVGVDAKNGKVAVNGWEQITTLSSLDFCSDMYSRGVKTIIYTDISKDGALQGTNMQVYRDLKSIEGLQIVASGGISYDDEIIELAKINTYGAIIGKALYEGKIMLSKAISLAGGEKQ